MNKKYLRYGNTRTLIENRAIVQHVTLNLQCRPRYSVRTFNVSHIDGVSVPYVRECI
jgi:hypothetical protein